MGQTTTNTIPEWTPTLQPMSSCPNMLPCGVCRLLMMNCPRQTITYTPTWTASTPGKVTVCANGNIEIEKAAGNED